MSAKKTIQSVLHNPRLPTLPAVAIRILELTRDENVNFREVADVIQNDQALAIKIIRTVNSSYFGLTRPCTSINQAMVYLGIEAVKTLVLGFSLVDSIDGSSEHDIGFDYSMYWRRSLYSAVAAREIAQLAGTCDPEEAFLAALIQDIGMVALYRAFRDVYLQVIDLSQGNHCKLIEKEQRSLEMDHTEVGAAIGSMWKLPEQLISTTRHHHNASKAPQDSADLVYVVELAGRISVIIDDVGEESTKRAEAELKLLDKVKELLNSRLGLGNSATDALLQTVRDGAGELASLFKVNIGTAIQVDEIIGNAEDLRVQREIMGTHEDAESNRDPDGEGSKRGATSPRGEVVTPPMFRQKLRTALSKAEQSDGCLGMMICEIDHGVHANISNMAERSAHWIAAEIGGSGMVSFCGSNRVMLLLPRADRITIARLADTIRQRIVRNEASLDATDVPIGAKHEVSTDRPCTINIGAAAYDKDSRGIVASEQKLIALCEQGLNVAKSVGNGAIRVFNPVPDRERAA